MKTLKTNAVIRIIIWSVVALVLVGLLISGLSGDLRRSAESWGWYWGFNSSYANSSEYNVGNGSVGTQDIEYIDVYWEQGQVNVETYGGTEIVFEETGNTSSDSRLIMRYHVEGDRLVIRFGDSGIRWTSFNSVEKTLNLKIPRTFTEYSGLAIETTSAAIAVNDVTVGGFVDTQSVSGKIDITDVNCESLSLESVSGSINAENVTANTLATENVSGSTKVAGAISNAYMESVSGSILLVTSEMIWHTSIETISGSATLELPENDGFNVDYSSISGGFTCDFETYAHEDGIKYKMGGAQIYMETISGSMKIIKAGVKQ